MEGKCHMFMKIVPILSQKLATSLPLSQWLEQLRFFKGVGSITVENSYIYVFSVVPLLVES